jgi:hypothetical protein
VGVSTGYPEQWQKCTQRGAIIGTIAILAAQIPLVYLLMLSATNGIVNSAAIDAYCGQTGKSGQRIETVVPLLFPYAAIWI